MYHFTVSVGPKSSCDISSFSAQGITELSQDAGWAILSFGAQNSLLISFGSLEGFNFLLLVSISLLFGSGSLLSF